MESVGLTRYSYGSMIVRWRPMLILSLVFHMAVFSLFFVLPETFSAPQGRPFGAIYEVDLVDMRGRNMQGFLKGDKGLEMNLKADQPARRLAETRVKEEEPLKVAKLKADMQETPDKKKENSSELIKETISKIEKEAQDKKRAKQEEDRQIEEAISGLKNKADSSANTIAAPAGSGVPGSANGAATAESTAMLIYRAEINDWIKRRWSYPIALSNQKDLEAVVVLLVLADGTIQKTTFVKRSANPVFDALVIKAIERANPLPPLPETYHGSYEEIEINFNLKDVKE